MKSAPSCSDDSPKVAPLKRDWIWKQAFNRELLADVTVVQQGFESVMWHLWAKNH
ncbi:hypothetical protein LEMLEM_LOCUS27803, partial [Lemmus lemmus]